MLAGPPFDQGGPAVEMLICMGPVIGMDAGGAPFDQIRSGGPAVEMMMIEKGSVDKKKC